MDKLASLVHDPHDENELGVKFGQSMGVELRGGILQPGRCPVEKKQEKGEMGVERAMMPG